MNTTRRFRHSMLLALATATATIGASGVAQATSPAPGELPPTTPADDLPPAADAVGVDAPTTTTAAVVTTTVAPTTIVAPSTTLAPTTTVAPSTTVAPTTTVAPPTTLAPTTTVPADDPTGQSAMFVVEAVTAPSAPKSPAATPGNASVALTWAAPSSNGGAPIDRYAVQRSTSAAGPFTSIAFPTMLSYPATGLTNGTQYYFRIVAHNSAGWGPASTVVGAVPRTVPTAPQSPVAKPGNTTVALTWAAPASNGGAAISNYVVQRSTNAAGPWTVLGSTTNPSYPVTGLTNGTKYYFRIRAVNAAGSGPFSSAVAATPRTVPERPQFPFATAGNAVIELSWDAGNNGGAPIDMYAVQRATSEAGPWTTVGTLGGTEFTDSNLVIGTTYYHRILAHNAAGWSAPSVVTAMKALSVASVPRLCNVFQTYAGSHKVWYEFIEPLTDGGSSITSYTLRLYNPNIGFGYTAPDVNIEADGSVSYDGAAANLQFADGWEAEIWATNALGSSPWCEVTFDMKP